METAISGLISASADRLLGQPTPPSEPATASSDWRSEWFVYMVADVSDETAAAITKAEAWPAYNAFFRLLWKRQREAEKAKNDKSLANCQAGILIGKG